jgi:hypothetical protein
MASKGLPGFLRRSLRRDFDEEDEEDRQSASNNKPSNVVVPDPGANNDRSSSNSKHNHKNDSGPLDNNDSEEHEHEHPSNGKDDAQEEEDSNNHEQEDYNHFKSPPVRLDSADMSVSSLASSADLTSGDNNNELPTLPASMDRQYSYRETQFEKTISADVVKMTELRNLSWNGVPVRNND